MMSSNSWTKSIVVVVALIAMCKPTTGGLGDFLSSIVNTCHDTACESHPRCPTGHDTLSTTHDGCSGFKEKNYCCPSGMGPQCFFTGCSRETSCPGNYHELDRTKNGCSGFNLKAYCCKTTNLPYCFDMSCPAFAESAKSCPAEYKETKRAKGRSAGCDSAFAERLTCCIRGNENENYGNHYGNSNSNTEVISETKTITMDDGSVRTITNTQTRSKSTGGLFSSSHSSFVAFFQILLLFPFVIVVL